MNPFAYFQSFISSLFKTSNVNDGVLKRNDKLLIVFGSYVNPSTLDRKPNDIDILQRGMSEEEINQHICDEYHIKENDLPFEIHQLSLDNKVIRIPVPWDSNRTNYKLIHYESLDGLEQPKIEIVRVRYTISSLLRDETKSVSDVVKLLSSNEGFDPLRNAIPLNVGEFDGSSPSYCFDYTNNYLNGRLSLKNAVDKHFGVDKFKDVCSKLWWGELLFKVYSEQPTTKGLELIKKFTSIGAPSNSVCLWIKNNPKIISCDYGFKNTDDKSVNLVIDTLYQE